MIHDFIWYTAGAIVFASYYLYIFETLAKIRKYRKLNFSDYGFGAFQPFRNMHEYRDICERNNENLLWYKAQIYLLYSFVVVGLLGVLIPFILYQ